ncbi:MAG: phosphotransferase [Planctomycetaceae bacterium]
MTEIDERNVVDYLRRTGRLQDGIAARAERLAWGVSNVVLRIRPDRGPNFVVKQSRQRLRTRADWFSRLDRIYREVDVMNTLAPLLPKGVVPAVLFEARNDYLFAMEAVAADHVVWKADLLAGRFEPEIAGTLGDYLATIHRGTAGNQSLRQLWSDRQVFDQLRLDPFYRRIADVHSEIRAPVRRLIEQTWSLELCAVHGDFSPKNVLIADGRLTLVDYETGHFGDPAFDLGFFLSHLLLKTVLHASRRVDMLELARVFWTRYRNGLGDLAEQAEFGEVELNRRTVAHSAACMLSRIDGKSPVDYLPRDDQQDLVRRFCLNCLLQPPESVEPMFESLEAALAHQSY